LRRSCSATRRARSPEALQRRLGRFRVSRRRGTIFLDENRRAAPGNAGRLAASASRAGSSNVWGETSRSSVDVRVLAATNRDLNRRRQGRGLPRRLVSNRLNVVPIQVPGASRSAWLIFDCSWNISSNDMRRGWQENSKHQQGDARPVRGPITGRATFANSQNVIEAGGDSERTRMCFERIPAGLTPAPADVVVPTGSLTADLAQRGESDHRGRAARCPRCHRRCDRCRGKAGPTETDSRITDEGSSASTDIVSRPHSIPSRHCPWSGASPRPRSLQPPRRTSSSTPKFSANAEGSARDQRGKPQSLKDFPVWRAVLRFPEPTKPNRTLRTGEPRREPEYVPCKPSRASCSSTGSGPTAGPSAR